MSQENSPSETAENGRNGQGRFARGNKIAKGNPFAKVAARYKRLLIDEVSDDDLRAIVRGLIDLAQGGNTRAAEILLDRLIGKTTAEPSEGDLEPEKPTLPFRPQLIVDGDFDETKRRVCAHFDRLRREAALAANPAEGSEQ